MVMIWTYFWQSAKVLARFIILSYQIVKSLNAQNQRILVKGIASAEKINNWQSIERSSLLNWPIWEFANFQKLFYSIVIWLVNRRKEMPSTYKLFQFKMRAYCRTCSASIAIAGQMRYEFMNLEMYSWSMQIWTANSFLVIIIGGIDWSGRNIQINCARTHCYSNQQNR